MKLQVIFAALCCYILSPASGLPLNFLDTLVPKTSSVNKLPEKLAPLTVLNLATNVLPPKNLPDAKTSAAEAAKLAAQALPNNAGTISALKLELAEAVKAAEVATPAKPATTSEAAPPAPAPSALAAAAPPAPAPSALAAAAPPAPAPSALAAAAPPAPAPSELAAAAPPALTAAAPPAPAAAAPASGESQPAPEDASVSSSSA